MRRLLKRVLVWFLILFSLSTGIKEIYAAIPDKIYLHSETERISDKLDYGSLITISDTIKASGNGSYTLNCSLFNLIPLKEIQVYEAENAQVAVSGKHIGIYMNYDGLLVIDTQSIKTSDGETITPAENKLKKGDYIKGIDGHKIESKEELIEYITESEGKTVRLDFIRNGKKNNADIQPVCAEDGTYKLGIWVRDDSQGIGTLTYIDRNGSFGALGHGVTDMDNGELLKIKDGEVYTSKIISIKKGAEGAPGELSGAIIYNDSEKLGTIQSNTEQGIFGTMDAKCIEAYTSMWYDVGYKEDIYTGNAEIRCSIGQTVECYDIEIEEVTLNFEEINKNFTFRVTDETLLEKTGGIVQGLSGSPIIQDGKLVGAVTHVLVNDPTTGYGIFIENMLDAVA